MNASSLDKSPTRQRLGRIGWGILLVANLLLFLIPANYVPKAISPQSWLIIMLAIVLLVLLASLVGFGLLVVRYLPVFKQARGTLALFVALLLGMRLYSWGQALPDLSWPLSQMMLLLPIWLLSLLLALPITMGIYLWHKDQSVRVLGYMLVIIVWVLVFAVNQVGPESLIVTMIRGDALSELMGMLCFGQSVILIALFFFVWHTGRLLYREWTKADMQLITEQNSESPVK